MSQANATELTATELLNALEEQERVSVVGAKVVAHFGPKYKACLYNARVIEDSLKAAGLEFNFENVVSTITNLQKSGDLLPPAEQPPAEPTEKPFDYLGLTYEKLMRMGRTEYKEKCASPVYRPVIDRILLDKGKS